MEKVFKILKINLLALVALPLLLLATFFKLVAKAFEQITIFLVLGVFAIIIIALLSTATAPKNIAELLMGIVMLAVVLGLIFLLVGWIFALISGVVMAIWNLLISLFDSLYDLTYTGYLNLYAGCETDYKFLSLNGKKVPNAIACLFFSILKGLSWIITTIVSLSYVLAGVFSAGIVILSLINLNGNIKASFGLNLLQYARKCELHSVIFGILVYLVIFGIIIVGVMALASEWFEWGQELRMSGKQISDEVTDLIKSDLRMASGSSEEVEKNIAYLKKLESHLAELEPLSGRVTAILEKKDHSLLRSYWGIYMRNLNPLVDECSDKKGIDIRRFKQLIPQIQLLDKQREDVEKLVSKLEAELEKPTGSSVFFAGCDSPEKLEKRYKALCKTYHPDIAEGDTATFQKMQAEYRELKAVMVPAEQKKS